VSRAGMVLPHCTPPASTAAAYLDDEFQLDLICPISLEIMRDPVKTVDGFTFERANIQAWFDLGKMTNPMTNDTLASQRLVPNKAIKKAIQAAELQ
jgi:hypothetical protein